MADGATSDRLAAIRSVPTLEALYSEAAQLQLRPGWLRTDGPVLTDEPQGEYVPAHWQYDTAKAALDAASRLIDVALAERRNLGMRNPAKQGMATTNTLVAAYQTILPGEKAPSHRHVPHALRVIIEGRGSYSTVDNEKTPMETGDVVLTPGWCWHEHGHDGDQPAYWFDGLDVPLTRNLEAMFYEENPQRYATNPVVVNTSPYRFTRDEIARRLDKAKADAEGLYGPRITLEAPTMPTVGLHMERLASGTATRDRRSTANHIFSVVEGSGETVVGDQVFSWKRGDTIAVPSWHRFHHRATSDAQLFDFTDEPLMRFARFYRQEVF